MEIKAKDMCPRCKHCLGMTHQGMYSCGKANDGSELNIGIDVILNCANFEWKDGKVEGKVSDICSKCKNCKGTTNEYDGNDFVVITGVKCEDPYDGMVKTLDADSSICCSMFEEKKEKEKEKESCDKISLLQHELEMDKLRRKIHQLEKEKAAHLKGIERLKNKNDKYLKKIIDQQARDYKQCARIMELEFAVNKLQSGEYDDILAKDIEIKSLQAKYEDVMSGWNHTIESHDKLSQTVSEQKVKIEELIKMVERRDRWVKELQNDVYTLQNEILTIRDIAQKAYDDTNRD